MGLVVPLWPVPNRVLHACRAAQARASFVVLCPSRLPVATRALFPWEPLAALEVLRSPQALDFTYDAPVGGLGVSQTLALDRPERFLHLVVGLATEGVPPGARHAWLGGHWGMLAPASAVDSYQGPYFADHARFVWRGHGVRYVATLHTFGERATTALLGRIVASLVPAARLAPAKQPPYSVEVGSGPDALAADTAGVWAATRGTLAGDLNGRLIRLDSRLLRPSVWPVLSPKGIRVAVGQGAVWTLGYSVTPDGQNLTPPELARVDPGTGRVIDQVSLGPGEATGLAIGAGSVWVTMVGRDPPFRAFVIRVDPGTMRIRTRTPVGRGAASLAVSGRSVWVVNSASNTVSRLDTISSRLLSTLPVGRHPFAIAASSGSIWVSNTADGTVSRIDAHLNRVTATISVGRAPYGVASDSHDVWVAVLGADTVVRIDANNNRITGRDNVHGGPLAIATTGRLVYVTLNTNELILRIDPTTLSPRRSPSSSR